MVAIALVDTSALVAAADVSQAHHARCVETLRRRDLDLVVPALVVTEAAYLIERLLGPRHEAAFIRGLAGLAIEAPTFEDWTTIAAVVERYADLALGTVDASIAVLADRLETDLVVTLDRRHFGVVRSPAGRTFRILPALPAAHESASVYASPPEPSVHSGDAEAQARPDPGRAG